MALKLDERYPGRADPASVAYPQGSFKNRTSPTAKDGTYLEKDWANDIQGFLQSLIKTAAITPSGVPDIVGNSQYFNALRAIIAADSPAPPGIATESIAGIAKIATQFVTDGGTNDTDFLTSKKIRNGVFCPIGVGQSWQNLMASRTLGVSYTNTSGRPIVIAPSISMPGGVVATATFTVNGQASQFGVSGGGTGELASTSFIVPEGGVYVVTATSSTITAWLELK